MNNCKSKFKNHFLIIAIILIFFILKAVSLFVEGDLWWDSSVYIGMGKYIYSSGKSGLWEPARPLIWPIMLGFFWKLHLDPILFGKILSILFSAACSAVVYLIALKLANRKAAVISAALFTFSPTFFLFNNLIYSEMPSTFFLLMGIYFFISGKNNWSGFFFGLSFMTRFFQVFFVIPVLLIYFYNIIWKKYEFNSIAAFLSFFFIPVMPYLILNAILYKNPIFPFILQAYMAKNTGWIYHEQFSFYLFNLLKENYLVLFAISGIYAVWSKRKQLLNFILFIFLFVFALYTSAKHKEMRFLMPLFPLIYIFASMGLLNFVGIFKKYKHAILALILLISAFQVILQLRFDRYDDKLDIFYQHMRSLKTDSGIWISNPSFIVYTDKNADKLIYYPLYDSNRAIELQSQAETAKAVFINTCDILPCPPKDTSCYAETDRLIDILGKKLKTIVDLRQEKCRYTIFER